MEDKRLSSRQPKANAWRAHYSARSHFSRHWISVLFHSVKFWFSVDECIVFPWQQSIPTWGGNQRDAVFCHSSLYSRHLIYDLYSLRYLTCQPGTHDTHRQGICKSWWSSICREKKKKKRYMKHSLVISFLNVKLWSFHPFLL